MANGEAQRCGDLGAEPVVFVADRSEDCASGSTENDWNVSTEPQAAQHESVEVLIVDDNEDAANSLAMLLELEDVAAAIAPDAEAALRLTERLRPTLLLIDIGLPGMNGYELAHELRKRPATRTAALIALTGRDAPADTSENGFDQFWTKPFDPRKLLEEIKALLDRQRSCVPESGS